MNKKIGILTFHRSINYGSFLQSYSLANALRSYTNFEVEIIDYNMTTVELLDIVPRPVTQVDKSIVKYYKFRKSLYTSLPISKEKLISNRISKAVQFLKNKYDVIIVGSDEVWKINRSRGFPNIYWLNDDLGCIKVSYAASANRTRFDRLDALQKEYIKDSLNKFSYIGARDENTINQLRNIDKKLIIKRNCDPAFLFDQELTKNVKVSLEKKLQKKYKLDLGKPIIGIMCFDDKICQKIYDTYNNNYQIVSLYIKTKYCNAYLYDLDPFEWAHIFSFLKLSITNFFHCTVFSIINNTPFIAIDVEEYSVLYESKIKDLLKRADMLENYFNFKHPAFVWESVFEKIENNIDTPNIIKMKAFVEDEKKYFYNFVRELMGILNSDITKLEVENE
ncbi:MAG: polysaccharide pyruvyl transferase family protein [Ruminiclostridium sp.]